jgi:hypothetical protein
MVEPVYLRVPISARNSIEEARQYCQDNFAEYNGHYIVDICLNCGSVNMAPEGNTNTAQFIDECSVCFEMRKQFPQHVLV